MLRVTTATTATTATLLLSVLSAVSLAGALRELPEPWPSRADPPPQAVAGVAGGAGGAELAEREVHAVHAVNGSLDDQPAPTMAGTTGSTGTIREALGGGVVEPTTLMPSSSPALSATSAGTGRRPPFGATPQAAPQAVPGGLRSSSRCTGPQVCLKVEHCPPAEVDLLFECAPGWVCCVPAAPSRPPQGHAPASPVSATPPQTPRPTPSHHEHHTQRPLHMKPEEGLSVPVRQPQPPSSGQHSGHPKPQAPSPSPSPAPTRASTTTRPAAHPAITPASITPLPRTDVCGKVTTENRITNGKIASPGMFPWMAILGYRRRGESSVSFLCGGTLINEKYVLTAAHCISSQNRPVLVRLGEFNLTEAVDCDHDKVCAPPPLDMDVEAISPHPDFDLRNIKHDIALIRLSGSVREYTEYVRPICLPVDVNVPDDKKFKIAGWGKTYFRDAAGSPVLQFTDVNGVGHAECNELQPPELQPLDPGQLCAGGDKGKDACKGDSGGPLMATLQVAESTPLTEFGPSYATVTYQVGVVSYGPDSPCGTAPLPSIYTRVTAYIPWILSTIRP